MRDAEAILCLAWATELLNRYEGTVLALEAARHRSQVASERLAAAKRCGDPRWISLAHAMLEDALRVQRDGEAASARVHRALEAVLDSLARNRRQYAIAAAARQVRRRGAGARPRGGSRERVRGPPGAGARLRADAGQVRRGRWASSAGGIRVAA